MAKSGEKKRKVAKGKGKKSEEPIVEEKVLSLTEMEMKDLALFEARRGMQAQVMVNLQQEQTLLNIEYKQKQAEIRARIVATKASDLEITREHNEFIAAVEARLGIRLPDYTYNESGLLTLDPIEEPPPPDVGEEKK